MTPTSGRDPEGAVSDALPVLVLGPDGGVEYASTSLAALVDGDPSRRGLDALVHPDDASAVAEAFVRLVDGDAGSVGVSFRLRDGSDDVVDATFVDRLDDHRTPGVVVVVGSAPGPGRRRLLRAATDLTGAVAGSESRREAVRTALSRVPSFSSLRVGFYLRGETDPGLRAVAPGGSADAGDGDAASGVEPAVRDALASDGLSVIDGAAFPLAALPDVDPDGGFALPVGDHGVLVAGVERRGGVDVDALEFLHLVAGVLRLGLDHVRSAAALSQSDREYRECRSDFRRLSAVVETVRRIERRVLRAETPAEVERAVCEGLVAADLVAFAWVGEVDIEDDRLTLETWAGDGRAYVDRVRLTLADAAPPAVRAAADRTTVRVTDVAARPGVEPWRREAAAHGFESVLAVPLAGGNAVRGVLAVYARESGALDDVLEQAVTDLARTVAHALDAIELRRALLGNTTVELRFRVDDADTPLAQLSGATDERVGFVSATPRSDGSTRVFFTVDVTTERLVAATEDVLAVSDVVHLDDHDDGRLFAATVTGETVPGRFASLGAALTDARAEDGTVSVSVAVSRDVDVRGFVESVRDVYPDAELLARRTRDQPIETEWGFRDEVADTLTDRQFEVLQAAYFGGYFEWPRDRSGADVADTLGIAQSTFGRHLRAAERKLLTLLFTDDRERGHLSGR